MKKITFFHEHIINKCLASKTKLLLILLFVSSFSFAQNWSQVGATQFTNFATDGDISFHPTTGEPYVVYSDVIDGNKPYVMKFDGANWVAVGTGSIGSAEARLLAIAFHPTTSQPWIAFKNNLNGRIDVYSFDGTTWNVEITNGPVFIPIKEIESLGFTFTAAGVPYIHYHFGSSSNVSNVGLFYINGGTWSGVQILNNLNTPNVAETNSQSNIFYNNIGGTGGNLTLVRKANDAGGTLFQTGSIANTNMQRISGIDNFWAGDDVYTTSPNIHFGESTNLNLPQPTGTDNNTNGILKLDKSSVFNNLYLMYSDASQNLQFQKYGVGSQAWSSLPALSVATSGAGFFSRMAVNPVNGYMYALYLESGRISVQRYEELPALTKYYVDANVTGGDGSGDSWTNAMADLNAAIGASGPTTTEIWVAAGTYKPTAGSRSNSFGLGIDNLQVYGGFDGTESAITERDIASNPTILSGDLNADDTGVGFSTTSRADNSYHVMTISGNGIVVDGFQINDGHANGSSTNSYAAGMLISDTVNGLTIKNCQFNNNMGLTGGAIRAYFNTNATIDIVNCRFRGNLSRYGSGAYLLANNNRTVNINIINSVFDENQTEDQNGSNTGFTGSGAWIRANGSNSTINLEIANCTFSKNTDLGTQTAPDDRGVLGLSKRTDGNSTFNANISNSIFYGNIRQSNATSTAVTKGHTALPTVFVYNSIDQASFSNLTFLTNTSSANPSFNDPVNNDFTLQVGSPAIDTGDNSKVPAGIIADLLFNQRIHNGIVDLGPYEHGASSTLSDIDFEIDNNNFAIYPNPTSNILHIKIQSGFKSAEIYNIQGKKIMEGIHKSIDVSNLSSGIYLIKIENESGSQSTKRFIKQ